MLLKQKMKVNKNLSSRLEELSLIGNGASIQRPGGKLRNQQSGGIWVAQSMVSSSSVLLGSSVIAHYKDIIPRLSLYLSRGTTSHADVSHY